ncbi:MAG: FRG domain-containing protein [Enterobacter hormaechei]
METLETKLFGEISVPSSLGELIEITENHAKQRANVYMWRGQGDIEWPIHSAAYRRLYLTHRHVTEKRMRLYELEILRKARHKGYVRGRRLQILRFWPKLQHHSAATRLIDFSRNILVALWLACHSEPKDGVTFGINRFYSRSGR